MKRYKSHKIVQAGRIIDIVHGKQDMHDPLGHLDATITVDNGPNNAEQFKVHGHQFREAMVGGYLIEYPGGYRSYSPAAAFEDGYTVVEEKATGSGSQVDRSMALPSTPSGAGPRVTEQRIAGLVESLTYETAHVPNTTSTIATARLPGGFVVAVGHSACVAAENFDAELGRKYAIEDARKKARDMLWQFEGYLLSHNLQMHAQIGGAMRELGQQIGLTFGYAIDAMRAGHKIARAGWNGKGQFVMLIQGSNKLASAMGFGFGEYAGEPTFGDTMFLKMTDNRLIAWTPSQSDCLATDWQIV